MAKLIWNESGHRFYESGIDRGVLSSNTIIPLDGIVSVSESSSGAEGIVSYLDGAKAVNLMSYEEFKASIQLIDLKTNLALLSGNASNGKGLLFDSQPIKPFNLSYRTKVGNELDDSVGYKIHLIYNVIAKPSTKSYSTKKNTSDLSTVTLDLSTLPVIVSGRKATSHIFVDSRYTEEHLLTSFETMLYGSESSDPIFPSISDLVALFGSWMEVIDNGDGTWTLSAPDEWITFSNEYTFDLDWPNINFIDSETYEISSI